MIGHLLTHGSGLKDYDEMGYDDRVKIDPCREYATEEIVPLFKEHQLLYEPGSKFHYSNAGYFLLGVIIEEVSGFSYEEFIQSEILESLEMNDTGYDRSSDIVINRSSGYSLDDVTYGYRNVPCSDVSLVYAAGALYTTVEDLYIWDQALLSDRFLSEADLKDMYDYYDTNQTIFEEATSGYDWVIGDDQGHRYISHGGHVPGHTAYLLRYPDDKLTDIVLSNFDGERPDRMSFNLARIMFETE